MTYIICEGAEKSAEAQFVKAYVKERISDEYHSLYVGGNRNILKEFYLLSDELKKDDRLLLFFDSIESIGGRAVIDILDDIDGLCEMKDVVFCYTTYYSFEEIFLSYKAIDDLVDIDVELKDDLGMIQKKLLNGTNYFDELDTDLWHKYIPDDNCYSNREHFSFVLINQLMKPYRFTFGVEKGSLGECWIKGCSEANEQIKRTCDKCRYRKHGCGFSEKLLDIEKDSVFSMSEQL